MRKILLVIGMAVALVVPITALAHAQLDVSKFGDLKAEAAACPDGDDLGAWYHFVLNQVGGDYRDRCDDHRVLRRSRSDPGGSCLADGDQQAHAALRRVE